MELPPRPGQPPAKARQELRRDARVVRRAAAGRGQRRPVVIEELAALAEPGLAAMTGPRFFGWVIGRLASRRRRGRLADQRLGPELRRPYRDAGGRGLRGGGRQLAARAARSAARMRRSASSPAPPSPTSPASPPRAASCCAASAGTWRPTACSARRRSACIIGDEAHASVFSALQFLGLGYDRVIRIPTDAMGRMRIDDVRIRHAARAIGRRS